MEVLRLKVSVLIEQFRRLFLLRSLGATSVLILWRVLGWPLVHEEV